MKVHSLPMSGHSKRDPEYVKTHLLKRTFQAASGVILGLALVLWILARGPATQAEDAREYFLPHPLPAPAFTLESHTGFPVSSSDFHGKLLAVFFGYTSCPDICPLTLSHLSQTMVELGELGDRLQILFITVDPARDTPGRLGEYLGAFGTSFLGLTGEEGEIRGVADGFGAFFRKNDEGVNYTVDHTARVFIVDGQGRIPLTFPLEASPREMARDLTLLLENPNR